MPIIQVDIILSKLQRNRKLRFCRQLEEANGIRARWLPVLAGILLLTACVPKKSEEGSASPPPGPSHVELRQTDGLYRLYVDGEPFFVKGAGSEFGDISSLAGHGANSFRTWRVHNGRRSGKQVLDEAHTHQLKVMMGIEVGSERHGFDYDDTVAVKKQLERIREEVNSLKDHPALLGWGIGNELNLEYTNMKVWKAVNEISQMIHELDPNHPTTTMLAGFSKEDVASVMKHAPDLDFLSMQMYGDIVNLSARIKEAGYRGPYLVSEWGATGHWEVPVTEWEAPIEQTSTEKAEALRDRYEKAIRADSSHCLGSYVFLWGQKQERTPTWYGLFTETGEETEAIDQMHHIWSGRWPENRAPVLTKTLLDGKERTHNIRLYAGKPYRAFIEARDPDGDPLEIRAEVLRESRDLGEGGDPETRPGSAEGAVVELLPDGVMMNAPREQGAYRMFIYVYDGHNHAATVNFPFYVME